MRMEESCVPISSWPPEDDNIEERAEVNDHTGDYDNHGEHDDQNDDAIQSFRPSGGKRAKLSFTEPEARISLAAWIRKSGMHRSIPADIKARSKLNYVATSTEGKHFLERKIRELQAQSQMYETSAEYFHVLATYCDLLAYNEKALDYCKKSLDLTSTNPHLLKDCSSQKFLELTTSLGEEDKERLWLLAKLETENTIRKKRKTNDSNGQVLNIDRVEHAQLSVEKFKSEYCEKRQAVVITGLPSPTPSPWNLEHIRLKCGSSMVSVKAPSKNSSEWAKLEEMESKRVAEFLDHNVRDHYLFDWSLPLNAPELAAEFCIPEYFTDNILTKSSRGALYNSSWPSLFIGPRGTRSALHIDAIGSHFWMFLISGTKRWTFYPAERAGDLNPVYFDSLDPVFYPDEKDFEKIDHFSIDLKAGELLFVPAGFPHKVENLEDTIAVSGNFVNRSNVTEFTRHLRINGLRDPRSRDLLQELIQRNLVT